MARWAIGLRRFSLARYFLVAGGGFVLSYAIFFSITGYDERLYLIAAPVAHWLTYFTFGFVAHKWLSFKDKRKIAAAWQLPADAALSLVWNALVFNPFLLWLLVSRWGWHPHFAQLVVVPYFLLKTLPFVIGLFIAHGLSKRSATG
ncbi:MAG TPA: hypothetical protein VGP13_02705 [Candidatus Paceibacterota bacterium]|jgi:hypothetical protein|nr:hypothetical protein [Candidatus Paceibacterota bacterium]